MEKEPKVVNIFVKKTSIMGDESIKIIGSLRKAHIKGMQEFIKGKDIEIEVKDIIWGDPFFRVNFFAERKEDI